MALENKSVFNLVVGSILFIVTILNIVLASAFVNYKKNNIPKTQDCINLLNRRDINSQEEIDELKRKFAEKAEQERIGGKSQVNHSDSLSTANITFSVIFMIISIFLISSFFYTGDELDFLNDTTFKKYMYGILGFWFIIYSIVMGSLLDKYYDTYYSLERTKISCVKISDVQNEEDVDVAFAPRDDLPRPNRTPLMLANISFAIILGIGGLIMLVHSYRIYNSEDTSMDMGEGFELGEVQQAAQASPAAPAGGPGGVTVNVNLRTSKDGSVSLEPSAPTATKSFTPAF